MSITPEYAEEVLIEQREAAEVERAAHDSLPIEEDLTEIEVAEDREAEEATHHTAS